MQFTFSTGFLNQCPSAVRTATSISAFKDFWRAISAIFTDRKLLLCSGPPSV